MFIHGCGNTCDPVSNWAGSTLVSRCTAFIKNGFTNNIMEDIDALFWYQLLLPMYDKPKSGMTCSVNLSDKSRKMYVEMFEIPNRQFPPFSMNPAHNYC